MNDLLLLAYKHGKPITIKQRTPLDDVTDQLGNALMILIVILVLVYGLLALLKFFGAIFDYLRRG